MKSTFCDRCGEKIPERAPKLPSPPGTTMNDGLPELLLDLCELCCNDFVKFMANERVLARER